MLVEEELALSKEKKSPMRKVPHSTSSPRTPTASAVAASSSAMRRGWLCCCCGFSKPRSVAAKHSPTSSSSPSSFSLSSSSSFSSSSGTGWSSKWFTLILPFVVWTVCAVLIAYLLFWTIKRPCALGYGLSGWSIGLAHGPSPFHLRLHDSAPIVTCLMASDLNAEFVADPFLVPAAPQSSSSSSSSSSPGAGFRLLATEQSYHMAPVDARWYLFFETQDRTTDKGIISVAWTSSPLAFDSSINSDGGGSSSVRSEPPVWHYQQVVLEEPFHLSYPFVFEHQGSHYMIPETYQAKAIKLYKAAAWPFRWLWVKNLLHGKPYVDTSPLFYQGRWYLFTHLKDQNNPRTVLFVSDTENIESASWTEHPMSPKYSGSEQFTRPGGRPVVLADGTIFRPVQDVKATYGHMLRIMHVTQLSPTQWEEAQATVMAGVPEIPWIESRTHHIDLHLSAPANAGGNVHYVAVMDGHPAFNNWDFTLTWAYVLLVVIWVVGLLVWWWWWWLKGSLPSLQRLSKAVKASPIRTIALSLVVLVAVVIVVGISIASLSSPSSSPSSSWFSLGSSVSSSSSSSSSGDDPIAVDVAGSGETIFGLGPPLRSAPASLFLQDTGLGGGNGLGGNLVRSEASRGGTCEVTLVTSLFQLGPSPSSSSSSSSSSASASAAASHWSGVESRFELLASYPGCLVVVTEPSLAAKVQKLRGCSALSTSNSNLQDGEFAVLTLSGCTHPTDIITQPLASLLSSSGFLDRVREIMSSSQFASLVGNRPLPETIAPSDSMELLADRRVFGYLQLQFLADARRRNHQQSLYWFFVDVFSDRHSALSGFPSLVPTTASLRQLVPEDQFLVLTPRGYLGVDSRRCLNPSLLLSSPSLSAFSLGFVGGTSRAIDRWAGEYRSTIHDLLHAGLAPDASSLLYATWCRRSDLFQVTNCSPYLPFWKRMALTLQGLDVEVDVGCVWSKLFA